MLDGEIITVPLPVILSITVIDTAELAGPTIAETPWLISSSAARTAVSVEVSLESR